TLLCMVLTQTLVDSAVRADPSHRLPENVEFWVAVDGNDDNPGTIGKPLKTLTAVRQRIRNHPDRGKRTLTVNLQEGVYYLSETLVLTSEDSGSAAAPVVYQAAAGKAVTLSGGQSVAFRWQPFRNGIHQADVPADFVSDQLFLNGQRQHMARYPDYDPDAQYFQGFSESCTAPDRVMTWADPQGGFLHAMHRALWGDVYPKQHESKRGTAKAPKPD
ncbi:MAG: hypothetical protein GY758_10850, partial [Fuerstiella sp.]|nr:hypothetical protein [Fuerstiella sp.]